MIRITKIESVLGDFGIHYYRKRTEETAAAIKAISAAVGDRIFGDILTAIDGAEAATGSLENVLESKIHALELDNAKLAGENIRLESFNQQLLQIVGGTRK